MLHQFICVVLELIEETITHVVLQLTLVLFIAHGILLPQPDELALTRLALFLRPIRDHLYIVSLILARIVRVSGPLCY